MRRVILSKVSISIVSAFGLLAPISCSHTTDPFGPTYPPGPELSLWQDPLSGPRPIQTLHPPREFAAYVAPHVDRDRNLAIGGHWILMTLTPARWYFEAPVEQEIIPDGEAGQDDIAAAREALGDLGEAVIPYRPAESGSSRGRKR